MTAGSHVALRRLLASDAPEVQAAFASASDMDRQGDVTTLEDAERYVRASRRCGALARGLSHR